MVNNQQGAGIVPAPITGAKQMIHLVITYYGKEVRDEYDEEQIAREDMKTLIENGFEVRIEYYPAY